MDESRGPWAPALRGPFLTKVQSMRSPPGLRCLHPRVRIGWVKNTLGPRRPASATSGEVPALGREAAGPALRRDVQRLESAAAPPRGGGFLGGRQQKPRGRDWGSSEKDTGALGRCEGWTRGALRLVNSTPSSLPECGQRDASPRQLCRATLHSTQDPEVPQRGRRGEWGSQALSGPRGDRTLRWTVRPNRTPWGRGGDCRKK